MDARTRHLLIVGDESSRHEVVAALEPEGLVIHETEGGRALREALASLPIDVVTLAASNNDEAGLAMIRSVREATDAPLIVVGAGGLLDRVLALELGADSHVASPFVPFELTARVRALIRRCEAREQSRRGRIAFGNHLFDPARREVRRSDGVTTTLTAGEAELLAAFLEAPGRILSRAMLSARLRGEPRDGANRSIDMLVRRLREKIEDDPARPRLIKTVRSAGYILVTPIEPR